MRPGFFFDQNYPQFEVFIVDFLFFILRHDVKKWNLKYTQFVASNTNFENV